LPFTLKGILRAKKNNENSNISPCKNIIFKSSSKKQAKILQDIIAKISKATILYNESKHNILALLVGKANKFQPSSLQI
jgi:hypothetical protein